MNGRIKAFKLKLVGVLFQHRYVSYFHQRIIAESDKEKTIIKKQNMKFD